LPYKPSFFKEYITDNGLLEEAEKKWRELPVMQGKKFPVGHSIITKRYYRWHKKFYRIENAYSGIPKKIKLYPLRHLLFEGRSGAAP
jgi:hypothetical protein